MARALVSTVCLILSLTAQASAQGQNSSVATSTASLQTASSPVKKFSAEWRLRMMGADSRDEQTQAKVVDVRSDVKAKYHLTSNLHLDLQPSLRLQSGQFQSVDGADKGENKISFNQAAAVYRPFHSLRMLGGALDQDYMHTSLLLDSMAFPAARVEALMSNAKMRTVLALESAIPTSSALSTNTKELEATPSLNTASLKFHAQFLQDVTFKLAGGYFIYNNLPSNVAQKSGLLGNEVNKISDAQYLFTNKFEGVEAAAELKFPVFHFMDLSLSGQYLVNQKAPANVNSAFEYSVTSEIHLTKNTDLGLSASYFSVAPEAAVSYFNARGYQTNRVGYQAKSFLAFKKEGFNVGLRYVDAEVMFASPVQSRTRVVFLQLETTYASL